MTLENPRFEASYARLFGSDVNASEHADEFFHAFYQRFVRHPQVGQLFAATDMQQQVQMLKRSLFQLVSYYVVGRPTPELDRIVRVHSALSLSGELYDLWMQALLDTVRQFDEQADEMTELAWCWALAPGMAYMQLGADRP